MLGDEGMGLDGGGSEGGEGEGIGDEPRFLNTKLRKQLSFLGRGEDGRGRGRVG